ncbi:SGNH/GDSL hydrolase family protein [Pontimicrobium sp. IMCC45349]|uniref:SGNH/GDSL hydrolase family protein n=1 Tax=Pontimicrobium sp. IMCC45349 TaxID=3391574 RepID=UPI00399F927A
MKKGVFFFLILLNTFSYVLSQQKINQSSKTKLSILFIGNSLTYTNNLPQLVEEYAKPYGITLNTKMIAYPNYAIEDHWKDGKVQKHISSKKYDFVIIQQGPSSQKNGRKMLIEYGKKYNDLCKLNQTQLCYFTVWPSLRYYYTFDDVIKNHKDAAEINNSILLPVGKVWKEYIDTTNNKKYYSSDGFHPSITGSQIAAKIIVENLLLHSKKITQKSDY